jgi:hypothetical protein
METINPEAWAVPASHNLPTGIMACTSCGALVEAKLQPVHEQWHARQSFRPARGTWRCVCGFETKREHPSCKNCEVSRFELIDPDLDERVEEIEDYLEAGGG